MKELEKAKLGYLYDANYDKEVICLRNKCSDLCFEYNNIKPSDINKRNEVLKEIFYDLGKNPVITQPIHIDYGFNISIGNDFYSNYNLTILDSGKVTIGNNVFIAPNCVITCAGHAIDYEQRNKGLEIARPITIGNNVWIGANVTILPGVTIGNNTIVGAGSIVNKNIEDNVIACGVPCKTIRKITEEDKHKYKIYKD